MTSFKQFFLESRGPSDDELKAIEDEENSKNKLKFIEYNRNYFKHGNPANDCVVRALSLTTNVGYKILTEWFKKKFIMGVGYASPDGISREEVDRFAKETKIIEKVWGDDSIVDAYDKYGITEEDNLQSFLDTQIDDIIKDNNLTKKRFVLEVMDTSKNKGDSHHYHMTSIVWNKGHWCCYDLASITNIEYSVPVQCYAVKKIVKPDSRISYQSEEARIQKQRLQDMKNAVKSR